jgi:UrcA family protein
MKSILASVLVIAAFGAGFSAAAMAGETRIAVSYASLDLSNPAGREILLDKLNLAAHKICGPAPLMADRLREGDRYDVCIKTAVDHAMASLPRNIAAKFDNAKTVHEASLR